MINTSNIYKSSISSNIDFNNFDAYDLSCYHTGNSASAEPTTFGTIYNYKNEETLYLRMELVTEKTSDCWYRFKDVARYMANSNSRGILSGLLSRAGTKNYPEYENIKECTGFTKEEFIRFTEKAVQLKELNSKLPGVLAANSIGSNHMSTAATGSQYIVYVTKNPHFSIQKADEANKNCNLKGFIDSYSDILIAVGSDFCEKESFWSRGIFRNPYWVFEGKYAGLSMLLHGFTGAVAEKYFPDKELMTVKPVGSMQYIIKQKLLPGEGYIKNGETTIDITNLEVQPEDPEGHINYIKISALKRIYHQSLN
jgi:hypothetical protein